MNAIYVFLGGGLGALCRWGLAQFVSSGPSGFPYATLYTNLLGCLLIGIASALIMQQHERMHFLFIVGFLGGFTTFSSFGLELFKLYQSGQIKIMLSYLVLSNVLGLLLVVIGNRLMVKML